MMTSFCIQWICILKVKKNKKIIHSMKPCVEEMDTPLGLFMAHIKIKQDSRMHLLSRMQSAVEPAAIDNGINARQYHT